MDSFNFTVTAETASAFRDWLDEQNRDFIEDLLDGKGQFTLEYGDRKVMIAPVRRGRWKRTKAYPNIIFCSECGEPVEKSNSSDKWNYCPNCGAKMEDEK